MSQRLPGHALDEVAHKWCALAARRCAHFLELHSSGRWRHYYSEEQFLLRMREAIRVSDRWAEIVGRSTSEAQSEPATGASLRPAA
jgi:uncharacterized repeat protein (TIGR03809 family)